MTKTSTFKIGNLQSEIVPVHFETEYIRNKNRKLESS